MKFKTQSVLILFLSISLLYLIYLHGKSWDLRYSTESKENTILGIGDNLFGVILNSNHEKVRSPQEN